MRIIRRSKIYDVCVVGSGAGGGLAARLLRETGTDVAMLEAGPMWNPCNEHMTVQQEAPPRAWK